MVIMHPARIMRRAKLQIQVRSKVFSPAWRTLEHGLDAINDERDVMILVVVRFHAASVDAGNIDRFVLVMTAVFFLRLVVVICN